MKISKYDAACRAIAEAKSVDEVKDVRDKAAALAMYARQANNKLMEIDCSEIRIRAERRVGQMMAAQKEMDGLNHGGRPKTGSKSDPVITTPQTLAELGIDKKLADRARKLNALPDDQFESIMAAHRELQAAVTDSTFAKLSKPHVSHNSGNDEWYTPSHLVESARAVMGSIDCDPASSSVAQEWINAKCYYTTADDGLTQKWVGNVWMNPPYSDPLIGRYAAAFVERRSEFSAGITLTNNATETEWCQSLLSIADGGCFPRGRIKYLDRDGRPANTPLQGQIFLYFGSDLRAFLKEFKKYGAVFRNA